MALTPVRPALVRPIASAHIVQKSFSDLEWDNEFIADGRISWDELRYSVREIDLCNDSVLELITP
jgi:hypothetical protein